MLDYSKQTPIVFPYQDVEINVGKNKEYVSRPMALVSINQKHKSMPALIDTGSDKTICYLEPWGKFFGVTEDDLEGEPTDLTGLGGKKSQAYPLHLKMWIGDELLNVPVYWIITPYNEAVDNFPIILGRNVVFKHFDVVFRERDKKVYFYRR